MKNKIILLLLFILNSSAYSQVSTGWVNVFNGTDNFSDTPNSVSYDSTGNVYVTGTTFFKSTFQDIVTIKYNPEGNVLWMKYYNSEDSSNDAANSIVTDNSGNIIVTGESMKRETGRDIITIKYNSNGDELWRKSYNGNGSATNSNNDFGIIAVTDSLRNIIIGGSSQGNGSGYDYLILKYDSNGNLLFQKKYTSPGNNRDALRDLKVDLAGNIYATGEAIFSGTSIDYLTIKYDANGNHQWIARYDGPISIGDYVRSIYVDESENVYVTGYSYSNTIDDILTVKYNSSGLQLWEARYNGSQNLNDKGNSVTADKSGNVYVAGTTIDLTYFPEYCVLKYDSLGNLEWIRHFDHTGVGSGEATKIRIDKHNKIYTSGNIERVISDSSNNDFILIKFDENGNRIWSEYFDGAGSQDDIITDMELDNSGNVYLTGKSKRDILNYDFATLKYSQDLSFINNENPIIHDYKLFQNYPNPFNPETIINFQIPPSKNKGRLVQLKIFDMTGKEIKTLVNNSLSGGNYSIKFNAGNLSAGVYFCSLISDGVYLDTKKLILVK